jgi:hypothetical protein
MAEFLPSSDDTERLTFFPDGSALIIRYSRLTKTFSKIKVNLTEKQYDDWQLRRMLIQDAMPHLDKEEREFIMTGYTPADWRAIFPPEEDEGE